MKFFVLQNVFMLNIIMEQFEEKIAIIEILVNKFKHLFLSCAKIIY
jgi:hypothetical protein